jgi:hypothetical protein
LHGLGNPGNDPVIAVPDLEDIVPMKVHVPPAIHVGQENPLGAFEHIQAGSGKGLAQEDGRILGEEPPRIIPQGVRGPTGADGDWLVSPSIELAPALGCLFTNSLSPKKGERRPEGALPGKEKESPFSPHFF